MTDTQIEPSRLVSAAEQQGPRPEVLGNHGVLHSPTLGPTLRKLTDARYARIKKYYPPKPQPVIARSIIARPEPVVIEPVAPEPPPVTLAEKLRILRRVVAEEFGITVAELMSQSRRDYVCKPRQIAMLLAVHILKLGYAGTARKFGKDHTTLLHAQKKVLKRMEDPDYAAQFERLKVEIIAKIGAKNEAP